MQAKIIDFQKGRETQRQKRKEASFETLKRAFQQAREGCKPAPEKPRKPKRGK